LLTCQVTSINTAVVVAIRRVGCVSCESACGTMAGSVVSCQSTGSTVLTSQVTGINAAIVVAVCWVGSAVVSSSVVSSQSTSTSGTVLSGSVTGINFAVVVAVRWVGGVTSGV
jgi:hypothetical protein